MKTKRAMKTKTVPMKTKRANKPTMKALTDKVVKPKMKALKGKDDDEEDDKVDANTAKQMKIKVPNELWKMFDTRNMVEILILAHIGKKGDIIMKGYKRSRFE